MPQKNKTPEKEVILMKCQYFGGHYKLVLLELTKCSLFSGHHGVANWQLIILNQS
jgi:hypothetical protein